MLETSILQLQSDLQEMTETTLVGWEGDFFQAACQQAQQQAQGWLEEMDAKLLALKPAGWRVIGKRKRTLVTRFGEVTFQRRLYHDEQGRARLLLDEVLGLPAYQDASAEVTEAVVEMASRIGFAQTAEMMAHLTGGVLSPSTVWRLVQRVGERVQEAEEAEVERVFGQGKPLKRRGKRWAERLYVEADGVMVRQRTGNGRSVWKELRLGVARDEQGKRQIYLQRAGNGDFWEGASVVWGAVWDWEHVQEVVVSGDDAAWIDNAQILHSRLVRQLDSFHLARAASRAAGPELGAALSQALQAGQQERAKALWEQVPPIRPNTPKKQKQARTWLKRHLDDPRLTRWWLQLDQQQPHPETLGHIESLVGAIVAQRMKGQRRHWSLRGMQHMGKVLQLVHNGELALWCGRPPKVQTPRPTSKSLPRRNRLRLPHDPGH